MSSYYVLGAVILTQYIISFNRKPQWDTWDLVGLNSLLWVIRCEQQSRKSNLSEVKFPLAILYRIPTAY